MSMNIPEGYALVPIEPTYDMCRAAADRNRCTEAGSPAMHRDYYNVREIWREMVKAAPKPKET